jgi:hypothetical protein
MRNITKISALVFVLALNSCTSSQNTPLPSEALPASIAPAISSALPPAPTSPPIKPADKVEYKLVDPTKKDVDADKKLTAKASEIKPVEAAKTIEDAPKEVAPTKESTATKTDTTKTEPTTNTEKTRDVIVSNVAPTETQKNAAEAAFAMSQQMPAIIATPVMMPTPIITYSPPPVQPLYNPYISSAPIALQPVAPQQAMTAQPNGLLSQMAPNLSQQNYYAAYDAQQPMMQPQTTSQTPDFASMPPQKQQPELDLNMLQQMARDLTNNENSGQKNGPDPRFPSLPSYAGELQNPSYSTQNNFGNPYSAPLDASEPQNPLSPGSETGMSQEQFAQEVLSRSQPIFFEKAFVAPQPLKPISQAPSNARFVTAPKDLRNCKITNELIEAVLDEVRRKNMEVIRDLPDCYKSDRRLILRATMIDPLQFKFAAVNLQSDENFLRRLLKANASILQFAAKEARGNATFMERAAYLNRDALQYATPELLDDKPFMKKMINFDSKNYTFASKRLQAMPDVAVIAMADDGMLLKNAPDAVKSDPEVALMAVTSNKKSFEFVIGEAQKNEQVWKMAQRIDPVLAPSRDEMEKFLRKNYVIKKQQRNLGNVISNRFKFSKKSSLISRNYVTKWQGGFWNAGTNQNELHLITANSRNYQISWKKDFKKYPDLIEKIDNFFAKRSVNQETIDNLSTTDLMIVRKNPFTLAFSLYLLRDSINAKLGPDFSAVTSLVAISQKKPRQKGDVKDEWNLSVVEVVFDNELQVSPAYKNGHRKYVLWDLYYRDENDFYPKVIFKIEDRNKEIFEVFAEASGGKYRSLYRIEIDLEEEPNL